MTSLLDWNWKSICAHLKHFQPTLRMVPKHITHKTKVLMPVTKWLYVCHTSVTGLRRTTKISNFVWLFCFNVSLYQFLCGFFYVLRHLKEFLTLTSTLFGRRLRTLFLFILKFSVSFHIVGQYVARSGMRKHKSWNVNFSPHLKWPWHEKPLAGPATWFEMIAIAIC